MLTENKLRKQQLMWPTTVDMGEALGSCDRKEAAPSG